jgi:hypothetical protein
MDPQAHTNTTPVAAIAARKRAAAQRLRDRAARYDLEAAELEAEAERRALA